MVWIELSRDELDETRRHFARQGREVQMSAMAREIILTTLGPEWWKNNLVTGADDPDEFLRSTGNSAQARFEHHDRVIRLGHYLWQLRTCEGYEQFVESLRTCDLEPSFFELKAASLLSSNGFEIEFVEPSGQKGEDYDLVAEKAGTSLSVEVKTRRSGPILTESKLENVLGEARKQLPAKGPGAVFLSIPVEWTETPGSEGVVRTTVERFFEKTGRVNWVILEWNYLKLLPEGGAASLTLVKQLENPNARQRLELDRLIRRQALPAKLSPEDFRPSFW